MLGRNERRSNDCSFVCILYGDSWANCSNLQESATENNENNMTNSDSNAEPAPTAIATSDIFEVFPL